MRIIAHRGNIYGPNSDDENKPHYIDLALDNKFDVEADIYYIEGSFFLGHDDPKYYVDMIWLKERIDKLWLHCKNREALYVLKREFNAFFHDQDEYTLTSKGYIWTYPTAYPGPDCVLVDIAEPNDASAKFWKSRRLSGVCTDYANHAASVITYNMV
jgi:hypothetical protein